MKKIMFSDEFMLTQAVLEGRKTQTRRIVSQSLIDKYEEWYDDVCSIAMPSGSTIETLRYWLLRKHTRYRAGEVVAVAQSYCSIAEEKVIAIIAVVLKYCELIGIDIDFFIRTKMNYNRLRGYKHGGKTY